MRLIRVFAPVVIMMLSAGLAYAGGGTALKYQGRLLDVVAGEPPNGLFDVAFSVSDVTGLSRNDRPPAVVATLPAGEHSAGAFPFGWLHGEVRPLPSLASLCTSIGAYFPRTAIGFILPQVSWLRSVAPGQLASSGG